MLPNLSHSLSLSLSLSPSLSPHTHIPSGLMPTEQKWLSAVAAMIETSDVKIVKIVHSLILHSQSFWKSLSPSYRRSHSFFSNHKRGDFLIRNSTNRSDLLNLWFKSETPQNLEKKLREIFHKPKLISSALSANTPTVTPRPNKPLRLPAFKPEVYTLHLTHSISLSLSQFLSVSLRLSLNLLSINLHISFHVFFSLSLSLIRADWHHKCHRASGATVPDREGPQTHVPEWEKEKEKEKEKEWEEGEGEEEEEEEEREKEREKGVKWGLERERGKWDIGVGCGGRERERRMWQLPDQMCHWRLKHPNTHCLLSSLENLFQGWWNSSLSHSYFLFSQKISFSLRFLLFSLRNYLNSTEMIGDIDRPYSLWREKWERKREKGRRERESVCAKREKDGESFYNRVFIPKECAAECPMIVLEKES